MLFPKTNIEDRLKRLRTQHYAENDILRQVEHILLEDELERQRISKNLCEASALNSNCFDPCLIDADKVYTIEQIRKICIDYRLRFLDTRYFKGNLPSEAVSRIKALEKEHRTELKGFKIIAPSKLFKLENADDPLLFAPIGNGYYYLIYKWGKDLHPLRKYLVLPFKSFFNLFITVLLISFIITRLIPIEMFTKHQDATTFWILFFFIFKMISAMVIFYGFALGKNFNYAIWNSKYYNS